MNFTIRAKFASPKATWKAPAIASSSKTAAMTVSGSPLGSQPARANRSAHTDAIMNDTRLRGE